MTKELFTIDWQGRAIEIRYCRNWSDALALSHLEVETIQPKKAPLPFTETGYRSHFTGADDIESAGGPVAYVEAWLDWASRSPEWKDRQDRDRQYALL